MSYVLVGYVLVHNMQGTGDRVVWVCSIRCCCIGSGDQTPFGVEHNFFFKNRLYDLGWCAGIRSDREFRGYSMCRLIYWRATLLYIAWFSHYNTIF